MKLLKTTLISTVTLAIFAGVFLCGTAHAAPAQTEPWNVLAEVSFQGKTYRYNLKNAACGLADCANRGVYLGSHGKKVLYARLVDSGLPPPAVREYLLPGFAKMLQFFAFVRKEKSDATVTFDALGFHYFSGQNGVFIDEEKLFLTLLGSDGKLLQISLPTVVQKAATVADLQRNTVPKATFTTHFVASNSNRCHNIALATAALNGTTVLDGQTFSFNGVVGPRSEQAGYKPAKVISDGVYVEGVGGGVCQVSTTLYNALLLSEVIPSACQHSLVPSYVEAGFDAMVSDSGADLTFTNCTGHPLYIEGHADLVHKCVTFTVYGTPNVHTVTRQSEAQRTPFATLYVVDPQKYPQLVFTDQTLLVTNGSDGVTSKSYLCYYDGDVLVSRRLIRQNDYKLVNRVVARGGASR